MHGLFLTWTQHLHRSYITAFIHGIWLVLTQPLAPYCLLFFLATPYFCYPLFYLLGEPAFLLMVWILIHSCPWFAINCSPFAFSPTLTHPIYQVTIFTLMTWTTSAVPVWYNILSPLLPEFVDFAYFHSDLQFSILVFGADAYVYSLFCRRRTVSFLVYGEDVQFHSV